MNFKEHMGAISSTYAYMIHLEEKIWVLVLFRDSNLAKCVFRHFWSRNEQFCKFVKRKELRNWKNFAFEKTTSLDLGHCM